MSVTSIIRYVYGQNYLLCVRIDQSDKYEVRIIRYVYGHNNQVCVRLE